MKRLRHRLWVGPLLVACAVGCGPSAPVPRYHVASRGGDSDGDGIADRDDRCAQDAEDGLPPKANDGCPADDPDNDGIPRATDKCPDDKEDGLPPDPTDGCASTDADGDGDGVADGRDRCPDKLEDNLPPDPNDGCPAPDADGDGVIDAVDKCPSEPETVNGFRDDDGCPDVVGDVVIYDRESKAIVVPPNRKIEFDPDSDRIRPEARATLQEVAAVLKQHPEIERVEIEGHASTDGHDSYNVNLTERRAVSVGQTLVAMGVERGRLVAIGYGEYCLAVETPDGTDEPRNRRVALKTVKVSGVWQDVPRGCWRAQTVGIDPTRRQPGVLAPPVPMVRPAGGDL